MQIKAVCIKMLLRAEIFPITATLDYHSVRISLWKIKYGMLGVYKFPRLFSLWPIYHKLCENTNCSEHGKKKKLKKSLPAGTRTCPLTRCPLSDVIQCPQQGQSSHGQWSTKIPIAQIRSGRVREVRMFAFPRAVLRA